MKTTPPTGRSRRWLTAGAVLATALSATAGTNFFDFNTSPLGILRIVGNRDAEVWNETGGNPGGYLAITDSVNSQYAGVLFDDFDAGLVVASFNIQADVRIGNAVGNAGRPADGFSISFARTGDPLIADMEADSASTANFAGTVPEAGSTTGLAVSFDTWSGNVLPDGPDIEGLIVRVDNVTLVRVNLPTRNGACDDITSLQTGPYNEALAGAPDELCWQKVEVDLADTGNLTVSYKGRRILDNQSVAYAPSRGRIILAGRTGNANENHHVDNLRIVTFGATKPVVGGLRAIAPELTLTISDSGTATDTNTISLQLNGAAVSASSITKVDEVTTIRIAAPGGVLFPSGSTQTVAVAFKDTAGSDVAATRSAVTAPYSTVTSAWRLAAATGPGINWTTHQIEVARGPGDANSIVNGENQISGSFVDPLTGVPYPNLSTEKGVVALDVVNLSQNLEPAGNFQDPDFPDADIPGIPGETGSTDNIVGVAWAYLELAAGYYRMGVNSDDGFTVSAAGGAPDQYGQRLGFFNTGRGASDTLFDFVITEAGFYPFRLSWWEGGGGANVEWFMVNVSTGQKILINDLATAGHVKAFRTASDKVKVRTTTPYAGFAGAATNGAFSAVIENGTTSAGDIQLTYNGAAVTPQIQTAGSTVTVSYTPPMPLSFDAAGTYELSYLATGATERRVITVPFTVRKITPPDLPAASFWIEAEDYNSNGVNTKPDSNVMPYFGGAFNDEPAFLGIDYHNTDINDSDLYRTTVNGGTDTAPNNVNMNDNLGGRWGALRPGGVEVTTNYKIGWVANGEWQNYTRNVPNGVYKVYAALSFDGTAADQLRGSLAKVTSNPAVANQTTELLGTFRAPGSGGWGPNDLVVMKDGFGDEALVKITAQPTTFRFNTDSGDFDYFLLAPQTTAPPRVVSATPANGADVARNKANITIRIQDFTTAVNTNSIVLKLNGATVPAGISKSGDITTVTYPIALAPIGSHTYEITFADTGGVSSTKAGTFTANPLGTPGLFLVEAEDFNYDGGQTIAAASVMPYLGLAYSNLNAVVNVDYGSNDGNDSRNYRTTLNPNKNMNENNGWRDRGTWEVTLNYKLGWADSADFGNYTRTIPTGAYNVYAALSHGDAAGLPDRLRGMLSEVAGDIATTNQTLTTLGTFLGNSTGGWGSNRLVPMTSGGSLATVTSTGAAKTYRFTMDSGDFDYFVFVPSEGGVDRPVITSVTRSGNNVTITWTGGGTLEVANDVTGPWTDTGLPSPVTAPIDQVVRFGRIKR